MQCFPPTTRALAPFGENYELLKKGSLKANQRPFFADATTSNTDLGDFRDGTNTDDDYDYWLDGSLKKDKNKKITSITYNYLKLT